MTKEQAESIIKDCDAWYVDLDPEMGDGKVGLDGRFTAEEIEAVLTLMRAQFSWSRRR